MKMTVQIVNPETDEIMMEEVMELPMERIPFVIRILADDISEKYGRLTETDANEFFKEVARGLSGYMLEAFLNKNTIGLEVKMSDILRG